MLTLALALATLTLALALTPNPNSNQGVCSIVRFVALPIQARAAGRIGIRARLGRRPRSASLMVTAAIVDLHAGGLG